MMKRVNYDQISGVYDQRYQAGGPAGIAKCLCELAHQIGGRRVLEVGCGTGYWLAQLPNGGIRCGLDYSTRMLDKARQRDDSLRLVRGTADRLPFDQSAFDFVFCVHALHHFDDPATFIHETCRVIRTGGALAIIGMDPQREPDQWYLYDYFPGTRETDRGRYPSGDVILHWMETAGFVQCERRLAARIEHDFVGSQVLNDPILQKNGTSQLALLTGEAFENGMARIREALRLAESCSEKIVFRTQIALPVVIGFVPDKREPPKRCADKVRGVARRVGQEANQMSGGIRSENCFPLGFISAEGAVENIAFYECMAEEYHSPSSPARQ